MAPEKKRNHPSAGRSYILSEITWKTVKETDYEVAILPWGATEPHNYHLPYGTDTIQCDYVAEKSARYAWEKGVKIVVLPTIPFGVNTGQLDLKLCINMNPSTQTAVLHDVIDSLSQQNIPKLVVLNGHGGNDFRSIIRELQPQFPQIFICTIDWYKVVDWSLHFEDTGDHGAEMETSVMLHIASEHVRPLSEAGEGKVRQWKPDGFKNGWAWAPRQWTKISRDTGVGNPSQADPHKGQKFLNDIVQPIGNFLTQLAACNVDELYE